MQEPAERPPERRRSWLDGGCGATASASAEIIAQRQVVLAATNVEQDLSNIFSNS